MLPISRYSIPRATGRQPLALRLCQNFTRQFHIRAVSASRARIASAPSVKLLQKTHTRTFSTTPISRLKNDGGQIESDEIKIYEFGDVQHLSQNPSPTRIIVDVRERNEIEASGVIPTAINIPLQTSPDAWFLPSDSFEDRFGIPMPSKDTELVFSCKAGVRSKAAAGIARAAGYRKVGSYAGSWLDWAKNTGGKTY